MAKRTRRSLREYLRGWAWETYSRTVNTLKTLAFQFPHPHLRGCRGKMQQKQCLNGAGIGCGNASPLKGVLYIPGQTESYTRIRSPSLGATGPAACTTRNQLLAERFNLLAQLTLGIQEPAANREWMEHWGPKPDEQGCQIAAEVMAKYGPGSDGWASP